ncbi:antileukoproteinase-like [Gopherus evgoodei]|uniref:antileukoproteinase-like n=1 Tax=Gopherus evgoodei TaxID=1825980 RepID=UPI0011CF7C2B|nr:antileukoproteinase-like [Gopherus evgoodei]
MKSLGVFFMVLLTLWMMPPSWSGTILPVQQIPREKPGTCPVVTVWCLKLNPPDSCYHDHQCPGPKKCCETSCGRRCILLQRGNPGTCPDVTFKCAMYNPPNRCHSDYQCPGFKKCCETFCGRACVYPKGHGKA